MITKADLETLIHWRARPGSPVLSVYLDVDQSHATNLNRGFEAALAHMLRSIEEQLSHQSERQAFGADAERVRRFVADYQPGAKSLVIFCDDSEDFFWQRELDAPVRNDAHWSDTPYVRPLLEILDEYERYGVILVDKAQARLFTVFMGEIEEHREAFATDRVRHTKTTGMDHIWSQKHFQRKADIHVRWHLRTVAEMMSHLADRYAFDRLVLAGPVEATSELHRLLPKRLRSRVIGAISMPVDAREKDVLRATLQLGQEVERAEELKLVQELIAAAARGERAVIGLEATVAAVQEGRVWKLIYAEGFTARGGECTQCSSLIPEERRTCPYCGGTVRPLEHFVERVVERVVEMEGRIEQVRGRAAERLSEVGHIGAVLRF